jgi:hypothetical protein
VVSITVRRSAIQVNVATARTLAGKNYRVIVADQLCTLLYHVAPNHPHVTDHVAELIIVATRSNTNVMMIQKSVPLARFLSRRHVSARRIQRIVSIVTRLDTRVAGLARNYWHVDSIHAKECVMKTLVKLRINAV